MEHTIEHRLEELGISLQSAPVAVGNYVPFIIDENHLFISGQICIEDGILKYTGHMDKNTPLSKGQAAARLCCINILTQAKAALGDLNKIERCLRLGGFVAATAEFTDHAQVINGASDLMAQILGTNGVHCRAAIGCSSLPLNSLVEVEALFKIKE